MAEKENPPPYSPAQDHGNQYGTGFQNPNAMQNPSIPIAERGYVNPGYNISPQYGVPQGQFAGQQMMSNNVVVASVGGGYGVPIYQTAPPDYTTQAWIACLCCFWPTGILAILKASESRDALARGDIVGAQSAANSARLMVRISFGVGIASIILCVILVVIFVVMGLSSARSNY